MPEQHAVGGCQGEGVGGRFLPGEMRRFRHQLTRLYAAELGKRPVRRLVAPNALRWREQRITPIAFFIVAVVLIAVDDYLIAYFPAPDLRSACPDNARSIGSRDVKGILVYIERRNGYAE